MRKKAYTEDTNSNYLTGKGAVAVFTLGESTIKRLARESGAIVKIGRCTRYKRDVLEKYIQDMQEKRA